MPVLEAKPSPILMAKPTATELDAIKMADKWRKEDSFITLDELRKQLGD